MGEYNFLVTGGLGFIGSNFVNNLGTKNVIVLDKMSYSSSRDYIHDKDIKIKIGNILNRELVTRILNKYKINIVVHFAAESHVDTSFYNSLAFTENNIVGTHNLIETVKIYNDETNLIKKFIHISTDEVYGEVKDNLARKETDTLNATNPYAATKAAAEAIVMSYYYSYSFPIIITRSHNIYGINQHIEKVIPSFITKSLKGEKLKIHGQGESRRSFLNVDDLTDALKIIIEKGKIGEVYNINSHEDNEYSVMELSRIILAIFGLPENNLEYVEDRKFNDYRYFICGEKISELGWKPTRINFKEELIKIIEWYRNRYEC